MLKVVNRWKTRLTGVLIIIGGSVQVYSEQLKVFMTAEDFAKLTVGAGVLVLVLGFLNTKSSS